MKRLPVGTLASNPAQLLADDLSEAILDSTQRSLHISAAPTDIQGVGKTVMVEREAFPLCYKQFYEGNGCRQVEVVPL